jgi:hypothetical protein
MAELPERLREAATAHRPDRERILARVERAIAAPQAGSTASTRERSPAPWMRVTAVAAAVAGAIGIGGLAVGAVGGDSAPEQSVATTQGTASAQPRPSVTGASGGAAEHSPAPEKHGGARSGHPAPGAQHPAHHSAGAPATQPAGTPSPSAADSAPRSVPPAAANGLASAGSVDPHSNPFWTENDIGVTTTRPLTSLTVELRVSGTSGTVSNSSCFTTAPGISATVAFEGRDLVYRWTLEADHVLAAGTYTFAGQFNHDSRNRTSGDDSYTVSADGTDGQAVADGGF